MNALGSVHEMNNIDEALQFAVDSGAIPGVVALAVDPQGPIYEGAFGLRGLEQSGPMAPDTVFWIASMTKPLAAAACLQLVERGLIDLDENCSRWVPALQAPEVLEGFDDAGQPILRPARSPITLRRLLTHTAGFAYDTWNEDMNAYGQYAGLPRQATSQRTGDCLPLAFDPGEGWAYGVGIDWAGKVLEAITGQTLDAYLQEQLFAPLEMTSTGFLLRPDISSRLAGMHRRYPDGHLEEVDYDAPQSPESFSGGGGLYGTAGDFGRFMRMILNGGELEGERILAPETVAMMGQNHIGELNALPLKTAQPQLSNDLDLFPGMTIKWGLSYLINTVDVPGRRSAGSLCWAGLRNTYFWIDPKREVAGALLTQILPFADPAVVGLFEEFEREVYRKLP